MKQFVTNVINNVMHKFQKKKINKLQKDVQRMNDYKLTKSRPLTLQENYTLITNSYQAEQMFNRLKSNIYKVSDKTRATKTITSTPKFIRESGKLPGNTSYFYVQPLNEKGWLFEQTSTGWDVSRAQKIVNANTFQRSHEIWDRVTLHSPKTGTGTIRITSERFQSELINLTVYQDKLIKSLNME